MESSGSTRAHAGGVTLPVHEPTNEDASEGGGAGDRHRLECRPRDGLVSDPTSGDAQQRRAVTFEGALGAWLDRHLPTDGSSPEGSLDQPVTPRIVVGLPAASGPIVVGVADDEPAVLPG